MHEVLQEIGKHRIVPVLVGVEDLATVLPVCDALIEGGLPLLEITLRTKLGADALRMVAAERPEMLLGAGTVLTPEQATLAVNAGAHFLVSPGLDPALVRVSQETCVPITPGACTPTEVQTALNLGVQTTKFFPATTMGGPETLKFMAGPYPAATFVATGGITPANMEQYLALPNLLACGGTWMFGRDALRNPDCAEILRRTRETVAVAERFREFTPKEVWQ